MQPNAAAAVVEPRHTTAARLAMPVRTVAPVAPAVKLPSRMNLNAVTKGKIEKPDRSLFYGTPGVGKSTLGSQSPNPIFLCAEDGTSQLDVTRFPEPKTWSEALEAIEVLTREPHDYKTLVIDTIDWLEPLCYEHICKATGKKSIEEVGGGFGKGYTAAQDEWRKLLAAIERLRAAKGMGVVLLSHSLVKTFKNPEGPDYDHYILKLNEKVAGIIIEWCDNVLFCRHETFAVEKDGKTKGVSSGARIMHTSESAAYKAKNRRSLPETLPLSWDEFAAACKAQAPLSPEKLIEDCRRIAADLGDAEFTAKVEQYIAGAQGDASKLARTLDWTAGKAEQIKQNSVSKTNTNDNTEAK